MNGAAFGCVRKTWFGLGLLLCAGFLYGVLMPNPPSMPGISYFDKMEHAGAFIVMAAWFGALFYRTPVRVLIALSLFGAATEIMQWLSGYRDGSLFDWLADTIGVVIGLGMVRLANVDWVTRIENRVATARD